MQENIREYYLTHKLIFEEMFSKSLDDFDKEAIHKMRTSTKRLRALFQLIEALSDKKFKAKKQLKGIRYLFKYTGKIRELQIESGILSEYEINNKLEFQTYREYLNRREHLEIARFLKALPPISQRIKILIDAKVLKAIENIKDDVVIEKTEKFISSKSKNIQQINSNKVSNYRVHQNRTIIKQLYYLFDILIIGSNESMVMGMTIERLREIEQMIGDWHDQVNSIHYLNAFRKTKAGRSNPEIDSLKHFMKSERDRMRKEIVKVLEVDRLKLKVKKYKV